jgi:hypothetical protein
MATSGYTYCTCRDCFDTAISNNTNSPNGLCFDCEEARCEPKDGECQRPDAYES